MSFQSLLCKTSTTASFYLFFFMSMSSILKKYLVTCFWQEGSKLHMSCPLKTSALCGASSSHNHSVPLSSSLYNSLGPHWFTSLFLDYPQEWCSKHLAARVAVLEDLAPHHLLLEVVPAWDCALRWFQGAVCSSPLSANVYFCSKRTPAETTCQSQLCHSNPFPHEHLLGP